MLNSSSSIMGVVALAGVLAALAFQRARTGARRSARSRARLIAAGGAGIALGLLLLALPSILPINRESPAAAIFMLGPWIVGGGVVIVSSAFVLGAALTPSARDGAPPPAGTE